MENSGAEVWNNEFDEILSHGNNNIQTNEGSAIYLNNATYFWGRSLVVGHDDTNPSNKFGHCNYGINSSGEANFNILNNEFGVDDGNSTDDAILTASIKIESTQNNTISILGGNKFYDFKKAIYLYNLSTETFFEVKENYFYDAVMSSSSQNFITSAISVVNPLSINFQTQGIIESNTIGSETVEEWQSRVGINLLNAGNVKIDNNNIYFHPDPDSENGLAYRGIKVENSPDCYLYGNIIKASTYHADLGMQVTGIRINDSNVPMLNCNKIDNTGFALHFLGTNAQVIMKRNEFAYYDHGIELGFEGILDTDIGTIQGESNITNIGYVNEWKNSSSDLRVDGLSRFVIDWYHDGAVNYTNIRSPVKQNNQPIPTVVPFGFSDETEEGCNLDSTAWQRRHSYADIVFDTARYEGEYAVQTYYNRFDSYYTYFRNDQSRLVLNEEDEDFANKYLQLDSSNVGKFRKIMELISKNKIDEANSQLENIDDTCAYELNLKQVLSIMLESKINNAPFAVNDTSVLAEIANLHSLIGGKAVFIARALLKWDIEDDWSGGARRGSVKSHTNDDQIRAFPNPTIGIITLADILPEHIKQLEMLDLTGRKISALTLNRNSADISDYAAGIYMLRLTDLNNKFRYLKIIKL